MRDLCLCLLHWTSQRRHSKYRSSEPLHGIVLCFMYLCGYFLEYGRFLKSETKNVTASRAEENGKESIVNYISSDAKIRKRTPIKDVSQGAQEIKWRWAGLVGRVHTKTVWDTRRGPED